MTGPTSPTRRPSGDVLVFRYGATITEKVLAVISPFLLPASQGFAWLMPVLFLKIVAGHMVREP